MRILRSTKKKPSLNKKNLRRVLEIIEKSNRAHKHKIFDYRRWFGDDNDKHTTVKDVIKHPCGTAACIGGWGCLLSAYDTAPDTPTCDYIVQADHVANNFFGLTSSEGVYLYYGSWHRDALAADTADVITKMRRILKTGRVIEPEFDKRFLL